MLKRLNSLVRFFLPPPQWRLVAFLLAGIICGTGALIFYLSNAVSYLSEDPTTCINCHVMYPQYATWSRSSHARVASCTDCHIPHDNVFKKYYFKMKDGSRHATIFTMRTEPQVIMIKEEGAEAVQQNCIRCHSPMLTGGTGIYEDVHTNIEGRYCWDCHRDVPHGRVRSLSATGYSHLPRLPGVFGEKPMKPGLPHEAYKADK